MVPVTAELSDVILQPPGFMAALLKKRERIPKVPNSAISDIIYPPAQDYASVPKDGIIYVMSAEGGERFILDKLGLFLDKNFKEIKRQMAHARVGETAQAEKIKNLEKGAKGQLKDIREAKEIMEKGEGQRYEGKFWEQR